MKEKIEKLITEYELNINSLSDVREKAIKAKCTSVTITMESQIQLYKRVILDLKILIL